MSYRLPSPETTPPKLTPIGEQRRLSASNFPSQETPTPSCVSTSRMRVGRSRIPLAPATRRNVRAWRAWDEDATGARGQPSRRARQKKRPATSSLPAWFGNGSSLLLAGFEPTPAKADGHPRRLAQCVIGALRSARSALRIRRPAAAALKRASVSASSSSIGAPASPSSRIRPTSCSARASRS